MLNVERLSPPSGALNLSTLSLPRLTPWAKILRPFQGLSITFSNSFLDNSSLFLAADVNDGTLFRVLLGLAQDLVCGRRGVAFAESDVFEQVRKRIALAPSEIDVR